MGEDRYYGVYRAVVLDVQDPMLRGRVRVQIPTLGGDSASSWAPVAAGTPATRDTVVVAFEEGKADLPIVIGTLWSQDETDRPSPSGPDGLYAQFRYRIEMDGREVAGANRLSGLRTGSEVVQLGQQGGSSHARSHGRTEYESITIERGMTHDREFEAWARGTSDEHGRRDAAPRRDLVVRQYDEVGRVGLAIRLSRCWVSEFQAVPDLDANANAVAIEHLKLEHEGWERDSFDETPSEGKRAVAHNDSPEE
jgi:phage tail-like protein